MDQEFAVMLGKERVGTVTAEKEGLYYRLHCSCRLSGQVVCRLIAKSGRGELDLGILLPGMGRFGIDTKVPAKRLDVDTLSFRVEPKHPDLTKLYVPIRPEEPFAYLSELTDSYLQRRNGELVAVIRDPDCGSGVNEKPYGTMIGP